MEILHSLLCKRNTFRCLHSFDRKSHTSTSYNKLAILHVVEHRKPPHKSDSFHYLRPSCHSFGCQICLPFWQPPLLLLRAVRLLPRLLWLHDYHPQRRLWRHRIELQRMLQRHQMVKRARSCCSAVSAMSFWRLVLVVLWLPLVTSHECLQGLSRERCDHGMAEGSARPGHSTNPHR